MRRALRLLRTAALSVLAVAVIVGSFLLAPQDLV